MVLAWGSWGLNDMNCCFQTEQRSEVGAASVCPKLPFQCRKERFRQSNSSGSLVPRHFPKKRCEHVWTLGCSSHINWNRSFASQDYSGAGVHHTRVEAQYCLTKRPWGYIPLWLEGADRWCPVLCSLNSRSNYSYHQKHPFQLSCESKTGSWSWFGTFFIFPYIGNFIIPTDELTPSFFRGLGRKNTNQIITNHHYPYNNHYNKHY